MGAGSLKSPEMFSTIPVVFSASLHVFSTIPVVFSASLHVFITSRMTCILLAVADTSTHMLMHMLMHMIACLHVHVHVHVHVCPCPWAWDMGPRDKQYVCSVVAC